MVKLYVGTPGELAPQPTGNPGSATAMSSNSEQKGKEILHFCYEVPLHPAGTQFMSKMTVLVISYPL